ncbi:GspH/FimT family pseudopilin [Reinekea forsetii]|nr:GspH/FimT family pseudopilin [Reinekea forsetii]
MKQQGFTMVELLSTVILIALVAAMAASSFAGLIAIAQSDRLKNDWVTFLNYGRSQAVLTQQVVTACPLINNECSKDLTLPWTLFIDTNENKKLDPDEELLRVLENSSENTFSIYPKNQPYFKFHYASYDLRMGHARGFTVCPRGSIEYGAFHLKVNITGRVRFQYKENKQGLLVHKRNGRWQAFEC